MSGVACTMCTYMRMMSPRGKMVPEAGVVMDMEVEEEQAIPDTTGVGTPQANKSSRCRTTDLPLSHPVPVDGPLRRNWAWYRKRAGIIAAGAAAVGEEEVHRTAPASSA